MNSTHRVGLAVGAAVAIAIGMPRVASAQVPGDPCAPLTAVQVAGVVGAKVGAGTKITPTACQWMWTDEETSTIRVTLQFLGADEVGSGTGTLPGVTMAPAPGLGDAAFYETVTSADLATLTVKKGSVAFVVRIYGVAGSSKQMAMERSLALDVLAKL
jgi:hypothetical protein